jgi:hypothetical protein
LDNREDNYCNTANAANYFQIFVIYENLNKPKASAMTNGNPTIVWRNAILIPPVIPRLLPSYYMLAVMLVSAVPPQIQNTDKRKALISIASVSVAVHGLQAYK